MQLQKQCQAGAPSRLGACRHHVPASARLSTVVRAEAETKPDSGRVVRRSLNQTGRYTRQPSNDKVADDLMETHGVGYSSRGLVAQMRDNGNLWQQGDVTVRLAASYGYCWGVERAVRMAYEARQSFPNAKLHMTNEIIHNPQVNQRMREFEVNIIVDEGKGKDFSAIETGDVVIFPAFGATVQELQLFRDKGVQMIDTTCPWVSKVWNAVDTHAKKECTSIIHGKYSHEETIATASFANQYVIAKDLKEAQYIVDYILNGGDKADFQSKFSKAMSVGFDPDMMLDKVGLANQTTMLKGETQQMGKMLEACMMKKYGPGKLNEHFMLMDTICDATQERQDAMYDLTADASKVDMILVVGGLNSSNTSHLQEIAEHKGIPSFWVDAASRIDVATNTILHKMNSGELVETKGWLTPGKKMVLGITSGASTPDSAVEDVLDQVFMILDPSFAGVAEKECAPMKVPTH